MSDALHTPAQAPPPQGGATRDELRAALGARRDLGPEYEDAVLDSFVARLEQSVAARAGEREVRQRDDRQGGERQFILGLVSLGTGIPISAIAGGTAEVPGLFVAWMGIVGVNVAHALSARRRR
ncbi:hypothetical protein [Vallicoccus soli]|uniref:Integral membrane protein n=1 Tax=Vallicoccus soli TaxID=2339232 RepID=A0A3A3ZAG3_9ACTN|nr:hypothetical protein [Vallicoccus soli]RJK98076.1 hypothetical protein D5H78_03845 [Vallicoccus soli]